MIRTAREYEAALKKLKQNDDSLSLQQKELINLGLSDNDMSLAMAPLINFRNQLKNDIQIYEGIKNKNWEIILSLVDLHNIGQFLIALRIAFGLTQRELAAVLGVTEAQVSKDERNEYHGISFDKAVKIMEVFGVKFSRPHVQKNLKKDDLMAANF